MQRSKKAGTEVVATGPQVDKLAETIRARLDALEFAGGRAQKALAAYAGYHLATAEDPDMKLKWFRECLNMTKLGLQSNAKERHRLAEELRFPSIDVKQ